MTFEQDIARLEEIAAELDGDGVTLDRALALFEEGVERLRRATGELARAEARVTQLVEQADGTFVRRPFSE
jgi:exodeoxyribonuclease VII small subunit